MDTIRAPLIESRNNIDCDKAYGIIREFLISHTNSFGSRYGSVDDFFTQIEFNKYLFQFNERFNGVESLLIYAKKNHSNEISARLLIVEKMLEHNSRCLKFAQKVKRLAKEEYDKFKTLSYRYKSNPAKYDDSSSFDSSMKGLFRYGTKSNYEKMTNDIPLCLYVAMSKFANGILLYEETHLQPLGEPLHPQIDILKYIQECLEKVSIVNLQQIVDKLNQQGDDEFFASGGSRRHTRRHRHRHGRTRRHHSKHSHKSVKRSKKGKKIMKSHTRKRHTRARKQNRRRNRSRK